MKKQQHKKNVSAGTIAAISAGVLALAAGSYYFFGPEGKKNRNKLKGWMIKMKGEVIEKIEGAKEISESLYTQIVDNVAKKYFKNGEENVKAFAESLKRQWKGIARSTVSTKGRRSNGTGSKSRKGGAKKSAKKATAKTA